MKDFDFILDPIKQDRDFSKSLIHERHQDTQKLKFLRVTSCPSWTNLFNL